LSAAWLGYLVAACFGLAWLGCNLLRLVLFWLGLVAAFDSDHRLGLGWTWVLLGCGHCLVLGLAAACLGVVAWL